MFIHAWLSYPIEYVACVCPSLTLPSASMTSSHDGLMNDLVVGHQAVARLEVAEATPILH